MTGLSIVLPRRLLVARCKAERDNHEGEARSLHDNSLLFHFCDDGRGPSPVQCTFLGPIGSDVENEILLRRGKPVGAFVGIWRGGLNIDSERAVRCCDECFVLGADGIALDLVG